MLVLCWLPAGTSHTHTQDLCALKGAKEVWRQWGLQGGISCSVDPSSWEILILKIKRRRMSLSTVKLEDWKKKKRELLFLPSVLWILINHSLICPRDPTDFSLFSSLYPQNLLTTEYLSAVYIMEKSPMISELVSWWIVCYSCWFSFELLYFSMLLCTRKWLFFSFCENILPQVKLYVERSRKCRKISHYPKSNKKVCRELMLLCGSVFHRVR